MKIDSLSAFMPVYNCEDIIDQSVSRSYEFLSKTCNSFELVIVDDNSTDKTLEKLQNLKNKYSKLKIVNTKNGPTRRENLAQIMKKAKYDIIFFQDVDLAVDLKYIPILIEKIEKEKNDIATGCRYMGLKLKQSLWRLFISKNYNFALRLLFCSNIRDHQCGFKAFKKDVFLNLTDDMGYDKKLKRGWFWDAELLIRAQKKKYSVYELPVVWKAGKASTFNIKRETRMIPYIIKFMFKQ